MDQSTITYINILVERKQNACVITVNRPDRLNALNKETIAEIGKAVSQAASSGDRAVIITGAGTKAFVAGADIAEFSSFTVEEGKELSDHGHRVFNSIEASPIPVIAAVNGFALGGGCELAMACHMRVASENAKFGQPEVKLGLIPGYAGTQRLPMLIGKAKAMELLLTADMIDAKEALSLGLVNHVTTQEGLMDKCFEMIGKITAQAPVAVSAIIKSVNAGYDKKLDGFQTEINLFGDCFITEDFKEGTEAFLSKRKPEFKGR